MDFGSLFSGLVPQIAGGIGGAIGKGLGASFGTLGAGAGGFLGNAAGNLIGNYFSGSGNNQNQSNSNQQFLKQVQDAQSNLLNQLQQRPQFQREDITPILNGVRQDFDTNVVPSIMQNFSSNGQGGLRSSSFRNALASAGSGLSQKLAELQASHAQDQQAKQLQYEGMNLNRLNALGDFINKQGMMSQGSWDPYVKAITAGAPLVAAGLNAYSGYQNRQNDLEKARLNTGLQMGNIGQQKQYDIVQHLREKGFNEAIIPFMAQVIGKMGGAALGTLI